MAICNVGRVTWRILAEENARNGFEQLDTTLLAVLDSRTLFNRLVSYCANSNVSHVLHRVLGFSTPSLFFSHPGNSKDQVWGTAGLSTACFEGCQRLRRPVASTNFLIFPLPPLWGRSSYGHQNISAS